MPPPQQETPLAAATPDFTPVPTVPPRPAPTPAPEPGASPPAVQPRAGEGAPPAQGALRTRPIKNPDTEKLLKQGKLVGPVVTFAGLTRADGYQVEPIGEKNGAPIFQNLIGSGFQLVIEGKPGLSNLEVGRRVFAHKPDDPALQPDLQIQVTRDLGDGSRAVCDRRRPVIGGIPAIQPPRFEKTQKISDALNDFACRFETMIEPQSSCVLDKYGDFDFVKQDSTTQFCMVVAKAWNFPVGDTLVSVRLRDSEGNPGPIARFWLRRPEGMPKREKAEPKTTPTPPRRRP